MSKDTQLLCKHGVSVKFGCGLCEGEKMIEPETDLNDHIPDECIEDILTTKW